MWISSNDAMVTRMLDVARVTSRDDLVDLGSGDGRVVIGAARRDVFLPCLRASPRTPDAMLRGGRAGWWKVPWLCASRVAGPGTGGVSCFRLHLAA
jgi:hypothetical protein